MSRCSVHGKCRGGVQHVAPTPVCAMLALLAFVLYAANLRAQSQPACAGTDTVPVARYSGRRISAVDIQSLAPYRLLGPISPMIHVTTRELYIRERLLFAVGDTVDTLRTAQSLRQLRSSRGLLGASLEARCVPDGGVALRVSTRDAWSLRPRVDMRGSGRVTALVEEANLLGTGRSIRVYGRAERGVIGVGAALSDPTLFHGKATATIAHDILQRGTISALSMQSRDAGALSEHDFAVALTAMTLTDVGRDAAPVSRESIQRQTATALIQKRVVWRPEASLYLQVGAEAERTTLQARLPFAGAGPAAVRRDFVGLDVGAARRSARYLAVPWLVPGTAAPSGADANAAEVPTGTELDAVLALGRDLRSRRPAIHVDSWFGRIWAMGDGGARGDTHAPRALLATDLWLSGYRTGGSGAWSAGDARFSLAASAPARRGRWTARAAVEHMADPDPDVRTLSFAEPLGAVAWRDARAAESAVTISMDRSVQLLPPIRGYALDGVAFGAMTTRWEVTPRTGLAAATTARIQQAVLGIGLRLSPTHFVAPTMTIGIGVPLLRMPGSAMSPVLSVSVSPPLGRGRQRARRAPYIPR